MKEKLGFLQGLSFLLTFFRSQKDKLLLKCKGFGNFLIKGSMDLQRVSKM